MEINKLDNNNYENNLESTFFTLKKDLNKSWCEEDKEKAIKNRVTYHFSFHIRFKSDVDVYKLSKNFNLEPYKLTSLKDSKGKNKTAKMWYRTKDLNEIYTGDEFEVYVLKMKEIFKDLPNILNSFEGECEFCIIFTDLNEKPCINLTQKTIDALHDLNASVDFDFYV